MAKMSKNLIAKYKFIWFLYTYHTITRYLEMSLTLAAWALKVARPHLQKHLPGGSAPDTTEPTTG